MFDKATKGLTLLKTTCVTGPVVADPANNRNLFSYVYFPGYTGTYFISLDDSLLRYYKGYLPQVESSDELVELLRNAPAVHPSPYKAEAHGDMGYMRTLYNLYLRDSEGNRFHWGIPAHQLVVYTLQEGAVELKLQDKLAENGKNCLEVNHMRSNMTSLNRSVFDKACCGYARLNCFRLFASPEFRSLYNDLETLVNHIQSKGVLLPDGKPWGLSTNETQAMLAMTENLRHAPNFPRDNTIENLELCTHNQNLDHARLIRAFDSLASIRFSAKNAESILTRVRQDPELRALLIEASKEPELTVA